MIKKYFIGISFIALTSVNASTKDIDFGESSINKPSTPVQKKWLKSKTHPGFIPLNTNSIDFIDIRAYGDSGWSWTHESPAMSPEFGLALDRFSPSGEIYRGDINFINWESTIGFSCNEWHAPYVRGRSYAFLADPENINQGLDRGIENFALSNNHTRDCVENLETGLNGQLSTIHYLNDIKNNNPTLNFHGISKQNKNKVTVFNKEVKGNKFTVAFASYYTGRESCPHSVCSENDKELIENFKKIQADLKVLMIHTMSDQSKLVSVAKDFINKANGDIVFGSGPHRWKPIRVIKKNKGYGIIFDSLGNFLHPSMASQSKNIIARILLNPKTKRLVQVQAVSVRNEQNNVIASELSPTLIDSEIEFIPHEISSDNQVFKSMYFNF